MTTTTTETVSSLSVGFCLIWETERPYKDVDRRSPFFTFKNCELYLKLVYDACEPPTFDLYMVTEQDSTFPTLNVKTYYRSKSFPEDFFVQHKKISNQYEIISRVNLSSVNERQSELKFNGNFTIVCTFDDPEYFIQLPCLGRKETIYPLLNVANLGSICKRPFITTEDQFFSFESLSGNLSSLLDNKILPDLQLMVGETSIPCHRAILAAWSKVFAAMFEHEMTESNSSVLEIKDIDCSTMELFLKYLYSGKMPDDLSEDILVKLFKTGDKYEVTALKKLSSSKMMDCINKENCLSYLSLADMHSDQEFKDAVASFIVKDVTLFKSSNWIQFSLTNPMLAVEVYNKYFGKEEIK